MYLFLADNTASNTPAPMDVEGDKDKDVKVNLELYKL